MRGASLMVVLALVVLAWAALKTVNPQSFNHDVGWTLHAAETLRAGGQIPADLFDTNPPLIYWLSVPLVVVAHALHLPAIAVMNAVVLLLASASAAAIGYLLRRGGTWRLDEALAAVGLALVSFIPLADYDYGQRDHLVLILLLPYLVIAALRSAERPTPGHLRAICAFAAAVAISLKPYYAVAWFAAEAYQWRATGGRSTPPWRQLDNAIIVASGAAYLAAVALFAPGWFEVMGMTMELYGAYAGGFVWFDLPLLLLVALSLVVLVALPTLARTRPLPADRIHLMRLLLLAAWLFFGVAAHQDMGFAYHLLPTYTSALLLSGIIGLTLVSRPALATGLLTGLLLLAAAAAYQEYDSRDRAEESVELRLARIFTAHPAQGDVMVLTTSVFPTFPAVNLAGRRSSSRFSCLWLLPGILAAQGSGESDAAATRAAEAYLRTAVLEDLSPLPAFIVEDRGVFKQGIPGRGFDLLEYFRADPEFRRIFDLYEPMADVEGYRVYVRLRREG